MTTKSLNKKEFTMLYMKKITTNRSPKTKFIGVRVTEAEYSLLHQISEQQHREVSNFVRYAAVNEAERVKNEK